MSNSSQIKKTPTRAGGIIFDKTNKFIVLVLNKDSFLKNENKWGLPKGHLNESERLYPHIGAQREIWEETGIYFPITEDTFSISVFDTLYYVLVLDKYHNPLFQTNDSSEIVKVIWFPIENLKNLNVNRTLAKIIKKWKSIFPNINTN